MDTWNSKLQMKLVPITLFIFEATKSSVVVRWCIHLWYHFHVIFWFLFHGINRNENYNSTYIHYLGIEGNTYKRMNVKPQSIANDSIIILWKHSLNWVHSWGNYFYWKFIRFEVKNCSFLLQLENAIYFTL